MNTLENNSIPNIQSIINFYSQSDYNDNYILFPYMIKRPCSLKLFSKKNILYNSFKEEKENFIKIHSNINRTEHSILEIISINDIDIPSFEFLKDEYIKDEIVGIIR